MKKQIGIFVMAFMVMAIMGAQPVKAQEYAYTSVVIGVSTVKSFTVTLNGQAATASDPTAPGTGTAQNIWFNATSGNVKEVNATVIGADDQVGPFPECTTPIAEFKNTGTVVEALNIKLNKSLAGLVFFYNSSLKTGSTTGTANVTLAVINETGSTFVAGLGLNNITSLCIWANFTSVSGGTFYTTLNYSSG